MNKIFHEKLPLTPQEIALIKFVAGFNRWVAICKRENIKAADTLELRGMLIINKKEQRHCEIRLSTYGLSISSILPPLSWEDEELVMA